jgi:hypothetical protein
MQAAPFSAFELHFELFEPALYLLPIGGWVLKAQLPQYIVKKYTGLRVGRKQSRQVLQRIARVAMKLCASGSKCFAMAPFKQQGSPRVDVESVHPGKFLKPLTRHHPARTGTNEQ